MPAARPQGRVSRRLIAGAGRCRPSDQWAHQASSTAAAGLRMRVSAACSSVEPEHKAESAVAARRIAAPVIGLPMRSVAGRGRSCQRDSVPRCRRASDHQLGKSLKLVAARAGIGVPISQVQLAC